MWDVERARSVKLSLELANPKKVNGIDRSEDYVKSARSRVNQANAEFEVGDAQSLPIDSQIV